MSNGTTIEVRRQSDGSLVEVPADHTTAPLADATGWDRLRRMPDADVQAAALADPDAQPVVDVGAPRVSRAKTLCRALGPTQEAFAARCRIPLGTLRDRGHGRAEPHEPARAYLRAIAGDPAAAERALRLAAAGPR